MSKSKKIAPRKKVALELLHHRLGHRSTISLMDGDTENVLKNIELRIDPYHFFKSCQISSINKKDRSKTPLKPDASFTWVFMGIIPASEPKSLTSEPTFPSHLLIVDTYFKTPKRYGMEIIATEEVMDKLDMSQSRFGKIDKFGWWDLERISSDSGTQLISTDF